MFKLLRFIKGKALALTIIAIFFTFAGSIFDMLQPLFLMDTVESVRKIQDGDPEGWVKFWLNVEFMALFAFFSLFFGLLGTYAASKGSLFAARNVRQGLFDKIETFSFTEIEKIGTGSLISRITNDVQKYQINLQMFLSLLLKAPVMIIAGLVMAFFFDPLLGGIVCGVVAVMTIIVLSIAYRAVDTFDQAQKKLDGINTILRETALGMRVIKSLGIQNIQEKKFDKKNRELKQKYIKGGGLMLPIMTTVTAAMQLGIVTLLLVGGFEVGGENPDMAGKLFGFTQILMIVLSATIIAIMVIVNTTRTIASIHRINLVFATENKMKEKINPLTTLENNSVEFKNVSFKFDIKGKKEILSNVSFKINQGETLGIIGGTGSGKSTVANLISRLYDVQKGEILVGNKNVKEYKMDFLHDQVGIVAQNAFLFSGTIKENLLFGKKDASDKEITEALKNSCALDFVLKKDKKFDAEVEQRGRNFSGGQKQRISLARTLIKKPEILILDDTTSALDLITEAKVQDNLINKYSKCTKIIISQRISSIKNANKILIIDKGKLVGSGTHDHLLQNNMLYKNIYNSQTKE